MKITSLLLIFLSIFSLPSSIDLLSIASFIFFLEISIPTIFLVIFLFLRIRPNEAPINPGPIIVISLNLKETKHLNVTVFYILLTIF